MAGPVSEIVSTTLKNRAGVVQDAVSDNNALLRRLKQRGNVKPKDGGTSINFEIEYADNVSYTRYSGYDPLNITPSDVITMAEYDWKQAAVAISMSGLEELKNSGKEKVIDLMEARITNAEHTMANNLSIDIYSAGTASGGQIGGLQLLVPDDPTTGTAGGISRVTYSWWRSELYDFSVAGATAGPTTIQTAMNTLYMRCSRGPDVPDLVVADNIFFGYYWASLQAIQRITKDDTATAGAGFQTLRFMGADVILDGGIGGAAPTSHMYMLNTRVLFFCPHKDRNMVPLDPKRFATNQDAWVQLLAFAGNLCTSNAMLSGVIIL